MELIKKLNEMGAVQGPDAQGDMQSLSQYWQENGSDMSEDELRDAIGMDLEQLEYTPDQAEMMIPQIMQMVQGNM